MRLVKKKFRRTEPVEKLKLEKVIGLTTSNVNGMSRNSSTGDVAYLAGCVVIIFSTATLSQTKFLMASRSPKALSCVVYSPNGGKLIAAGESGHQPAVIIWDASDGSVLAELKAHKYGVSCVQFSPNGKHLISVGFPHDGQICLFDYKSASIICKVKAATATSPISQVLFAPDGSFFVTAGCGQLKYWTVGLNSSRQRSGTGMGPHTLDFKNISLGSLRESSFVSVACLEDANDVGDTQSIYALTTSGVLCLLHRGIAVKKWVNLKVREGHSLCISGTHVACACSDGIVRIFMTESLAFATTLPRPAPIGFHDLTDASTCEYLAKHNVDGISYPDAVACQFATPSTLAVVYGDHSFFIWNVDSMTKVSRLSSFLSHSGCIWDAINIPIETHIISPPTCDSPSLTVGTFATCSSDGSIRLWCIDSNLCEDDGSDGTSINPPNVYDKTTCGVLYQDKHCETVSKTSVPEAGDQADFCKGFRSISASSDGHYLAAGDRNGNLHIYDLHSLQIVSLKEAHDAEILTLSFGTVVLAAGEKGETKLTLLATGGRDRLVHIYDASRNFEVIETLDDHSASVTAAKFACDGQRLLSASADKSVVFRNIEAHSSGLKTTRYHQEMASRGTIYDMDIDPSRNVAVTVGQDKKINFLSLENGKSVKSFKPEGELGDPIKVQFDPTGTCFVCSHSDKSLRIYDMTNGEMLCSGQGHSEVITGVVFTSDCRRLISVSGDSCIFVWKLPNSLSRMIKKKCPELHSSHTSVHPLKMNSERKAVSNVSKQKQTHSDEELDEVKLTLPANDLPAQPPAFTFSVSRLPHWAQTKVSENVEQCTDSVEDSSIHSSSSRWTERLAPEGYKLFCEPEACAPPATVVPAKFGMRRRYTIEPGSRSSINSPDSSLESQPSGTSTSTPNVSTRKENHWKTVHTVFFDEEEGLEDDAISDQKEEHVTQKLQLDCETGNKDDSTVLYLSDNEQDVRAGRAIPPRRLDGKTVGEEGPKFRTPVPVAYMVTSRSDRVMSGFFNSKQSSDSSNNGTENNIESKNREDANPNQVYTHEQSQQINDEEVSDDDSENQFSLNNDLFNDHFGNLSTAIKQVRAGPTSARSSFSTRFFARSSNTLPVLSLFQDEEGSDNSSNSKEDKSPKLKDKKHVREVNQKCKKTVSEEFDTPGSGYCLKKLFSCNDGPATLPTNDQGQQSFSTFSDNSTGRIEHETVTSQSDTMSAPHSQATLTSQCNNETENSSDDQGQQCYQMCSQKRTQDGTTTIVKCDFTSTAPSITALSGQCDNETRKAAEEDVLSLKASDFVNRDTTNAVGRYVTTSISMDSLNNETFSDDGDGNSSNSDSLDHTIALSKPSGFVNNKTEKLEDQEITSSNSSDVIHEESAVIEEEINVYPQKNSVTRETEPSALVSESVQKGNVGAQEDSESVELNQLVKGQQSDIYSFNGEMSPESSKEVEQLEEFKKCLQGLAEASDKALSSFKNLNTLRSEKSASHLSNVYEEFIPPTLQKIWMLSDKVTATLQTSDSNCVSVDNVLANGSRYSSCLDSYSVRLSNAGFPSRHSLAASVAPTMSALESIDIENFVQKYSVRFSETIASQVLTLVQKGLSDKHEK